MNEVFLNSTNVNNFNVSEVVEAIIDGSLIYDKTHKVTRLEILSDGTSNIYGIENNIQ